MHGYEDTKGVRLEMYDKADLNYSTVLEAF